MTDTNDLRRMLDELADETPELPAQEWIAGTRHKVRVRRRVRWTGGGAAAALVLAAAATVVPQVLDGASEPVPPAEGDGVFPERLYGGELIAARTNQTGEAAFGWQATLDEPTSIVLFCQAPEDAQSWGLHGLSRAELRVVLEINGQQAKVEPCAHLHWYGYPPVGEQMVLRPFDGKTSAPRSRARSNVGYAGDWAKRYGWRPGEPLSVSVRLERKGESVEVPEAEFGVAFYDGVRLGPKLERSGGSGTISEPETGDGGPGPGFDPRP
jgi:hypothetical protein